MSNVVSLFGGSYKEASEEELEQWLALVPTIRTQDKYFSISLAEILVRLGTSENGKFEFTDEVWIGTDEAGEDGMYFTLRCNLCLPPESRPHKWSVALKLGGKRIDGIDHEWLYDDADKNRQQGWHRHIWKVGAQSADEFKEPIIINAIQPQQFVAEVLGIMGVVLSGKEVGQ